MMKLGNSNTGLQKKTTLRRGGSLKTSTTEITKSSCLDQRTKLCSNSTKLETRSTELRVKPKTGSSRLEGDRQQWIVTQVFDDLGIEVKETQNSGATNYDGDLVIQVPTIDNIRAECKYRNTDGFTVSKKHWKEIQKKSLKHGGCPGLITINKSGQALVTMDVKDLAQLISSANKG